MSLLKSLFVTLLILVGVTCAAFLLSRADLPLQQTFTEWRLTNWDVSLNDWVFVLALFVLALEAVRYALKKMLSWNMFGDAVANFITLYAFLAINYLVIYGAYIGGFYLVYEYASLTQLPINIWTILACLLLADLAYYWEHRMLHRVGVGWATHSVHHSSPYFNISVAYRFGPLDGVMPFFFHLPLAAVGFHPMLIFLSESMVQLYQTLLHTESVKKLPRPIEAVMNTPSHHRVHHGMNPEYIDKNYAGMLIVWDRMFGTFAEEKTRVIYGVTEPLNSVNPFIVFLHGLTRLGKKIADAPGAKNKIAYLLRPPDWRHGE